MPTLTIELPEDVQKGLEDMGRAEDKPVEQVAADCLQRFIRLHELREIQKELAPYARAAGFESDEDFFREIS